MKMNRREFLKTSGVAAAVSLIPETRDVKLRALESGHSDKLNGRIVHTSCGICMVQCGMRVYVEGDSAKWIEGNPAEILGAGTICGKGKGNLDFLYNPDRLKFPLKRTNPEKGIGVDPMFKAITWEEALDEMAGKIFELTDECEHGERLMVFSHGEYGWVTKLLTSMNSPNLITHYDTCFNTFFVARKAMLGGNLWTNLAGAKYLLCFGWNQVERAKNVMARSFTEAKADGAKVVVFDPVYTVTASKADEWYGIKPGTDLAVHLAMINIILSRNRFDQTFVNEKTNFLEHEEEIRANYAPYTVEWASEISGVPADDIERLAMEFSDPDNWPAVIPNHKRDGAGGPNYANSHYVAQTIITLNALVGAIDREGGQACMAFGWSPMGSLKFSQSPEKSLTQTIFDVGSIDGKHLYPLVAKKIPDRGLFHNVARRIMEGDPYPVKMAIFRRYDLPSFTEPQLFIEAMKTLEYIVTMDTLPTDLMWLADIVLPESTFMEWEDLAIRKLPTPGYKSTASFTAVHKPLWQSKDARWVYMELGKRLDILRGTQYFWLEEEGRYVEPLDPVNAALKSIGLDWESFKNLPDGVYKQKSPYKSKSSYNTGSGKIEIYASAMEDHGYNPLPTWIERSTEISTEYPFYMLVRRPPVHKHAFTINNPILLDAYPENVAMMHEETLESLGIEDGEVVHVTSPTGDVQIKVKSSKRIRRDCVMMEHGFGRISKWARYAYNKGACDGILIPQITEEELKQANDWSGNARMVDVCVNVHK